MRKHVAGVSVVARLFVPGRLRRSPGDSVGANDALLDHIHPLD